MVAKTAIQRVVRLTSQNDLAELTGLMVVVGGSIMGGSYVMSHKLMTDPHLRRKRQNGHPKE